MILGLIDGSGIETFSCAVQTVKEDMHVPEHNKND